MTGETDKSITKERNNGVKRCRNKVDSQKFLMILVSTGILKLQWVLLKK